MITAPHTAAEIAAMPDEAERLARSSAYNDAWWRVWCEAAFGPVVMPDWHDRALDAAAQAARNVRMIDA